MSNVDDFKLDYTDNDTGIEIPPLEKKYYEIVVTRAMYTSVFVEVPGSIDLNKMQRRDLANLLKCAVDETICDLDWEEDEPVEMSEIKLIDKATAEQYSIYEYDDHQNSKA